MEKRTCKKCKVGTNFTNGKMVVCNETTFPIADIYDIIYGKWPAIPKWCPMRRNNGLNKMVKT
jgi:hypothetical protein